MLSVLSETSVQTTTGKIGVNIQALQKITPNGFSDILMSGHYDRSCTTANVNITLENTS